MGFRSLVWFLLLFVLLHFAHSRKSYESFSGSQSKSRSASVSTEDRSVAEERSTSPNTQKSIQNTERENVHFSTEEERPQSAEAEPTSVDLSLKCIACRGAVEILRFLYERNSTTDKILSWADYLCRKFADTDALICKGITGQFREPFVYVLEQMVLRPKQLCGIMMKDCGIPDNPFDGNWTIPLPPKPKINKYKVLHDHGASRPPRHEDKPVFKILQISDLHFDYSYQNGSEADCGKPLCCQHGDIHDVKEPAGYWGSLGNCDVPLRTIESMFVHISREHMRKHSKKIDYILLTGDYMSHADWSYTKESHINVINNLSTLINTYFPETPVFWGIGNHEGVPVNTFAPHTTPRKFWPEWLYKTIYNVDQRWIPPEQYITSIYRGSFSCLITEKLKLVSVNTGYCETTNFFLYLNQTDPDGTLQWLVDELYDAEQKGIVVHIMAHIPPGDSECLEGWARNYYRIVIRFENTIKAQFFGHVHTDSFTVFYENMNDFRSRPVGVMYLAPSVTTYQDLNPAYRIYYVDGNYERSSYEVLNYETYYLNLSRKQPYPEPEWELLYSAKEEYGLADLSPQSWNELGEKMRFNSTLYNTFLKNYARRDDYTCDVKCRAELLCSLRRGHHNESALCPENSVIRRLLPSLVDSPFVDSAVLEPLTRDEFLLQAKHTIVEKVSSWLFG